MTEDKLDKLFELQKALQERLKNDYKYNVEFYRVMTLALIDELMESLRNTPWKPWKKKQDWHKELLKQELIDAWHFLINLSLAADLDSKELYDEFVKKNKINHERQDKNY